MNVGAHHPAALVIVIHLIPGHVGYVTLGDKVKHGAIGQQGHGTGLLAGGFTHPQATAHHPQIFAVAGFGSSGAGGRRGQRTGLVVQIQLPIGQLKHVIAPQVGPHALLGFHGIPGVIGNHGGADHGQHCALGLHLARCIGGGAGRFPQPHGGGAGGNIAHDGGGRRSGQRAGNDGAALGIAQLGHGAQDEAEGAQLHRVYLIPGFIVGVLGDAEIGKHGAPVQLSQGLAPHAGAQIHAALDQLDIALIEAGGGIGGIRRSRAEHRGGLGSGRGRGGRDGIAGSVAVDEAVGTHIAGNAVIGDQHPGIAAGGLGVSGISEQRAHGHFIAFLGSQHGAGGSLADVYLILDQLDIAAGSLRRLGGRGGRDGRRGQHIIAQLRRGQHPQSGGGQIARFPADLHIIPVVGRIARRRGQHIDHRIERQHVHGHATGALAHVDAAQNHQRVGAVRRCSGRGSSSGVFNQRKIIAVNIACIRTGGIGGDAALDLIPGNATMSLGIHDFQHFHGPAQGQAGPEIAGGAHGFAEKYIVRGDPAIGQACYNARAGRCRGGRHRCCGWCGGHSSGGIGVQRVTGGVAGHVAIGADVASFAVVLHQRPIVFLIGDDGIISQHPGQGNLIVFIDHAAAGRFMHVHAGLHRAHIAQNGPGGGNRRSRCGRRQGLWRIGGISRGGHGGSAGGIQDRGVGQPGSLLLRSHHVQEAGHHVACLVRGLANARCVGVGADFVPVLFLAQHLYHPVFRQACDGIIGIVIGVRQAAEIHHPVLAAVVNDNITVLLCVLRQTGGRQQRQRHRQHQRNGDQPFDRLSLLHRNQHPIQIVFHGHSRPFAPNFRRKDEKIHSFCYIVLHFCYEVKHFFQLLQPFLDDLTNPFCLQ